VIGCMWEDEIDCFLNRAKRLQMMYGNAAHHHELIAQQL